MHAYSDSRCQREDRRDGGNRITAKNPRMNYFPLQLHKIIVGGIIFGKLQLQLQNMIVFEFECHDFERMVFLNLWKPQGDGGEGDAPQKSHNIF